MGFAQPAFSRHAMRDSQKTKAQLVGELMESRERIAELLAMLVEQRQTEQALRESEEKFRSVAERNFDLIYELDLEGRITYLSSAGELLSGGNRETILGTFFQDHLPEYDRQRGIEALAAVARGQSLRNLPLDAFRYDGTLGSFEFNTSPLLKDGQIVGIQGIGKDVTELKQAQEKEREVETLREIDRLRTELLANVSHELRTPLATIKGYATMLLNYDTQLGHDAKQEHLTSIDNATDHLMDLINQLLDMSHLEAGVFNLRKESTRISDLIHEATVESQARVPEHRLVLKLPKRLPKVYIDARRIRQVVDNLIDNATKYSQPGTEVTIKAKKTEAELIISVSDQGAGIPEENLDRVFDRMYRVEQEQSANQPGGIGLGLSICQSLIEAHNGKIWIESKVGEGTTCFFSLPLATQ